MSGVSLEGFVQLHEQGRIQEAYNGYRQLLQAGLQSDELFHLLGVAAVQLSLPDEAVAWLERLHSGGRARPESLLALASAYLALGNADKAIALLLPLSEDHGNWPQVWNNLGNAWQHRQAWRKALAAYERALALQPQYAPALLNRAVCQARLGETGKAIDSSLQAIRHQPDNPEAWLVHLQELRKAGQLERASQCLREALKRFAAHPGIRLQEAALAEEIGDSARAKRLYRAACKDFPNEATAWAQLAYLSATACDWNECRKATHRLIALVKAGSMDVSPFVLLALIDDPELHRQAARQWQQRYAHRAEDNTQPGTADNNKNKLTIAYLSADFYKHPTAYLAAELFEQHDRHRFRVLAYSNGPDDGSAIRQRLERGFDAFYDIRSWSVDKTVRHMREQQVDVLIDLKGYTENNALDILALRPAPVQMTYLGYPGALCADFVDYNIVDKVVVPQEQRHAFDERLIFLPGCYQVNDSQRPLPEQPESREVFGFSDSDTVIGCFNNSWKISEPVFNVWLQILRQHPDCRLWLMDRHPLSEFRQNIIQSLSRAGLGEDRVVFAQPAPYEDYLAYYRRMDLLLDTFPYNAHTMASDALWMGCPLVTLQGKSFASRVGASLLQAVLPEHRNKLVAGSLDEYHRLIHEWVGHPEELRQLRTVLDAARSTSPLFKAQRFVRCFEEGLLKAWRLNMSGKPPEDIVVI